MAKLLRWSGDIIGVVAFALVFVGVDGIAGRSWALLSLGVPFAVLYVWTELRRQGPPREED